MDGRLALAVLVLLAVAWYLSWTATRLDRLHTRVEGARATLDAALARRSAAAAQLATSGLLDPASALVLADAAHEARTAPAEEQELRQADLTRAVRATLDDDPDGGPTVTALAVDPQGRALLTELAVACHRATLARRFHNDAVAAARVVRAKRVVRWAHLAGRAPLPTTFETDDDLPPPLLALAVAAP
ncbi:MAG: hypothetical protein ACTHQ3_03340 [Motilibacteraceae bacterium]